MDAPVNDLLDQKMMARAIALSVTSGKEGEYPYAAVVCRGGEVVFETINRVARDRDVTRHAEVVAISEVQKRLGTVSLDDCTFYTNAEPCAFCCYALRESRMGRVVFALRSPLMGGLTRWNILADAKLSDAMPEVFAPPPEILAGFMCEQAQEALRSWNPVVWGVIRARGMFGCDVPTGVPVVVAVRRRDSLRHRLMAFLRRNVFDRLGRG